MPLSFFSLVVSILLNKFFRSGLGSSLTGSDFSLGIGFSGFGSSLGCSLGGVGMLGCGKGSSGTGLFVVSFFGSSLGSFFGSGLFSFTILSACFGALTASEISRSSIIISIKASLSSVYFLAGSVKNVSLINNTTTIDKYIDKATKKELIVGNFTLLGILSVCF